MKKKSIVLLITLSMILGTCGCGNHKLAADTTATTTEAVSDVAYDTGSYINSISCEAEEDGLSYGTIECKYQDEYTTEEALCPVEDMDWNTEEYRYYEENSWMSSQTSPFSTFAADVDTASYANLRRMLVQGSRIPADAVRLEEMINYFHYDYPEPATGEPFSVTTQIAPCPWNDDTDLLLVGLKAQNIDLSERKPSNLVFLIDVSGSMDSADKLPLVQRSFSLLCRELDENDRISIVT